VSREDTICVYRHSQGSTEQRTVLPRGQFLYPSHRTLGQTSTRRPAHGRTTTRALSRKTTSTTPLEQGAGGRAKHKQRTEARDCARGAQISEEISEEMNVLYGQNKAQKHVTVHAVQIGEEMSVEVSVVSCRAAIIRNPH
jgi:hypothetical protein